MKKLFENAHKDGSITSLSIVQLYMEMVQEKITDYWARMEYTFAPPNNVTVDMGRKYARIVSNDGNGGQRTVHTFVNLLNGDILKCSF